MFIVVPNGGEQADLHRCLMGFFVVVWVLLFACVQTGTLPAVKDNAFSP